MLTHYEIIIITGYIVVDLIKSLCRIMECLDLQTWSARIDAMFVVHYHQVFTYTYSAVWKYCALLVLDIVIALQWISCSLLITFLSLILTARLRVLNNHMDAYKHQV